MEDKKVMLGALFMEWKENTLGAMSIGTRMKTTLRSGFSFSAAYAFATRANSAFVELYNKGYARNNTDRVCTGNDFRWLYRGQTRQNHDLLAT